MAKPRSGRFPTSYIAAVALPWIVATPLLIGVQAQAHSAATFYPDVWPRTTEVIRFGGGYLLPFRAQLPRHQFTPQIMSGTTTP